MAGVLQSPPAPQLTWQSNTGSSTARSARNTGRTYSLIGYKIPTQVTNPVLNTDPEGLDYWIENAAETEQRCPDQGCGAHQSFCVGKPTGKRFCISFGRLGNQGWCLVNCTG